MRIEVLRVDDHGRGGEVAAGVYGSMYRRIKDNLVMRRRLLIGHKCTGRGTSVSWIAGYDIIKRSRDDKMGWADGFETGAGPFGFGLMTDDYDTHCA